MFEAELLLKVLIVAIVVAVVVLLFSFITGRFLDLTIEKSSLQEYSKAFNMLHVLGNMPDLAAFDSNLVPMKLVFNSTKLDSFNNKGEELDCCNYADFDYWVGIKDLDMSTSIILWQLGFPEKYINENFYKGKQCQTIEKDKPFSTYSIPATVKYDWSGDIHTASVTMKFVKTPLSNIAFNVLRACNTPDFCGGIETECSQLNEIECHNQKECSWHELTSTCTGTAKQCAINFSVYNIKDIEVTNGDVDTICVTLDPARYGIERACKDIVCELTIEKTGNVNENICDEIAIKRKENKVKIIV